MTSQRAAFNTGLLGAKAPYLTVITAQVNESPAINSNRSNPPEQALCQALLGHHLTVPKHQAVH